MNSDINLVAGSNILSKEAKRLRVFRTVAIFLIISVGFLSVLLFLLNRFFSPQILIDQQNQVITQLSALQTRQAQLSLLSQRLNDIQSVLKKRSNYDTVLTSIISGSPSDVNITSLSIDKGKISMIVASSSLLSINDFIDMLKVMVEKKQYLKNVTINNLTLQGKSGYALILDLNPL